MARFRGTVLGILVCLFAALDFFQTLGKLIIIVQLCTVLLITLCCDFFCRKMNYQLQS